MIRFTNVIDKKKGALTVYSQSPILAVINSNVSYLTFVWSIEHT